MKLTRVLLFTILLIKVISCNSNNECSSTTVINLLNLVEGQKENVDRIKLRQVDSLDIYFETIEILNNLSLKLLDQTGGFISGTNDLVDPCKVYDKSYKIFEDSGLKNQILKLDNQSNTSTSLIISNVLKHYFYQNNSPFNKSYFVSNQLNVICSDLFVVELYLYDIILSQYMCN